MNARKRLRRIKRLSSPPIPAHQHDELIAQIREEADAALTEMDGLPDVNGEVWGDAAHVANLSVEDKRAAMRVAARLRKQRLKRL